MRRINLVLSLGLFFSLFSANVFAQNFEGKLGLLSFDSRSELTKKFGPGIADQIPQYFNFRKYKLVAFKVVSFVGKKVKLSGHEKGRNDRQSYSFGWIDIDFNDAGAAVLIYADGYQCLSPVDDGDAAKRKREMTACYANIQAERKREEKEIRFFAFLKEVNVTTKVVEVEPRP